MDLSLLLPRLREPLAEDRPCPVSGRGGAPGCFATKKLRVKSELY